MADTTDATTRTLKRLYLDRDGNVTKKLGENVVAVILETVSGAHRTHADLAALFPDGLPNPCMGLAAAAFGLNTVLGNEIAGKDKSDPMALATLIRERWEAIREGEWSEGRQGPRIKDVLLAWAEDAKERGLPITEDGLLSLRGGKPSTDSGIEKMRAKLMAGEVQAKDLLNRPAVNAWYQKAKAEKAAAEFERAKAAAATSDQTSQFDDVFE